jgi:hypothetical protein
MTFVRAAGKASLGPKGRNTLYHGQGAVQGYVDDDHAFTRGPGAIAALDAASSRRLLARAKRLATDARRDRARARVAMGAVPIAAAAKVVGKTLLPGMKAAAALRPGTVQSAKYPSSSGYKTQTFGGPGSQGLPSTGGARYGGAALFSGARAGRVLHYAGPQIFGVRQTGGMSPGQITIPGTAPSTGTNVSPITGGGGGGGGGDGTQIDDGGGDLSPIDIDTSNPDAGFLTEPGGDVSQIASQTTPTPTPLPAATPAPDNTTRNWLLAGAALVGAYWLFKKR